MQPIFLALAFLFSTSNKEFTPIFNCQSTTYKNKNQTYQRYPFKSAKINYSYSGNAAGTSEIYIDDFGQKELKTENSMVTFMGVATSKNEGTLLVGSEQTQIDYVSNTARRSTNPLYQYYANNGSGDYLALGEMSLQRMGFRKIGKEKILGRECDIWNGPVKIWTWKGLTLKTETKMMGMHIIEEATAIQIDIPIDQTTFELPSNIEITGGITILEEAQRTMDIVVDPNTKKALSEVRNLSYEDWKKRALSEDPELNNYTEEELREEYEIIKDLAEKIK